MKTEASSPPAAGRQERRVPRFDFVATAELKEPNSAMRLSGRVAEISRHGCYVDIMNSMPAGTLLTVQISSQQGKFECKGKIIYVQERIGMGIAFMDPPEDQLRILDSWLVNLSPM